MSDDRYPLSTREGLAAFSWLISMGRDYDELTPAQRRVLKDHENAHATPLLNLRRKGYINDDRSLTGKGEQMLAYMDIKEKAGTS